MARVQWLMTPMAHLALTDMMQQGEARCNERQ